MSLFHQHRKEKIWEILRKEWKRNLPGYKLFLGRAHFDWNLIYNPEEKGQFLVIALA